MTQQDSTASFDAADLDIAPISTASTPEQLQEVMDVAKLAANAQRDLEAEGVDPFSEAEDETPETPESNEQPAESPAEEPAEESAQESEEQAPEEAEPEEEAEPLPKPKAEDKPKPGEPTYSRRDAARFKTDLDAARTELQQTRAVLQQHQASDASIIRAIQEQAGSEDEYAALTQKNNMGRATDQERQRLSVMAQWRQVAGPIYRTAQQQVVASWSNAFQAVSQLDGMTDERRQQVNSAADPRQALEAIHAAGHEAGTEQAQAEAKAEQKRLNAEIQRLKAEVSSLKTKVVTTKPAPAAPDGVSPAAGPKLPPMLLEDGTLNPEFEKLAHSGKLYGLEKLTG